MQTRHPSQTLTPTLLRQRFQRGEAFAEVPLAPAPGAPVVLSGLPGASKSLLLAALREESTENFVVLCSDEIELQDWLEDLALFSPERADRPPPRIFPELETEEDGLPVASSLLARHASLSQIPDRGILLADLASWMAQVARLDASEGRVLDLSIQSTRDPRKLLRELEDGGLRRMPQVLKPGEVSLRGDVLDLYPIDAENPFRIEFFDEEIESIRRFDPLEQKSIQKVEALRIPLPGTGKTDAGTIPMAWPMDLLDPRKTRIVISEPVRFEEQLGRFTLREGTVSEPVAALRRRLPDFPCYSLSALPAEHSIGVGFTAPGIATAETGDLKGRILAVTKQQDRPFVVLRSEAERKRLLRLAKESLGTRDPGFDATVGSLSRGFRIPEFEIVVLNHGEFFGTGVAKRRYVKGKDRKKIAARAIESFFELKVGDLVVHAVHGIAKFVGLERASRGNAAAEEDHLRLRFARETEVLVPVSKIDLVQKYVGSGGDHTPKLDKLGSKSFARRKASVAQALRDMASDLLEIQVERARRPAIRFPEQDEIVDEFVASFPFEDTKDQTQVSEEIRKDLASAKPMDRLLCGDVGFGKTEIAMRAAFRAASAGYQALVLVPTTLLAEQHGRTLRDRMASFPVRVEVLSRLQKPAEKKRILADTNGGLVDILIGTHALLTDKLKAARLGLLIIDEEQRFGVAHKEKLKELKANVDVLTLTATPIPRTLHMSLLGIKDISSLATPPPGRLEITTKVLPRSHGIMRQAILKELQRGGQVFFLHNRVQTLHLVRDELRQLVPEARIVTGHGQMTEKELLRSMTSFLSGAADVLLATTIIGSGIDIPRANTILVDRADMFGLADLHQLRGRVGRDITHAHCYLLLDPTIPLRAEAKQRLAAMERFSGLGSGFSIAMRDLEIRGAGNLLGPEQSGHIAAIGYDMYCKLLQAAVDRVQDPSRHASELPEFVVSQQVDVDLGVDAYLPADFVDDSDGRLALLREMDGAVDEASFTELRASLEDRFGRLPPPVIHLLSLFLIKHQLGSRGMAAARYLPPDQLILTHLPGRGPQGQWLGAFLDVRAVQADCTHLILPEEARNPEDVMSLLRASLLGKRFQPKLRRKDKDRSRGRRRKR